MSGTFPLPFANGDEGSLNTMGTPSHTLPSAIVVVTGISSGARDRGETPGGTSTSRVSIVHAPSGPKWALTGMTEKDRPSRCTSGWATPTRAQHATATIAARHIAGHRIDQCATCRDTVRITPSFTQPRGGGKPW